MSERNARPGQRFVLEAVDPVTECIASDATFEVEDVRELRSMIDSATTFDGGTVYELTAAECERIEERFNVSLEPGSLAVRLRHWCPLDDLPYKIHTGRELDLMLRREKPLAVFSEHYPSDSSHKGIPERTFAPYVEAGTLLRREHFFSADRSGVQRTTRMVLYALPGHGWRIEAYILLQRTAAKSGWNEGFERMQGSLLGYEDWQNDVFIEEIYRSVVAKRKQSGGS